MSIDNGKSMLGITIPLKIGTYVLELHPIRLKDWPKFSNCVFILALDNLGEVYKYTDGDVLLRTGIKVISRQEELPDFIEDMDQSHYKELRQIVAAQNEIDYEELMGVKSSEKKIQPKME